MHFEPELIVNGVGSLEELSFDPGSIMTRGKNRANRPHSLKVEVPTDTARCGTKLWVNQGVLRLVPRRVVTATKLIGSIPCA